MRRSVGRTGAPASIPKQPGRAARFTDVGAAGQIGSRTDPPHCTSRHRVDVDRARDWPYLSEPESLLPDRRPPEPLFASASGDAGAGADGERKRLESGSSSIGYGVFWLIEKVRLGIGHTGVTVNLRRLKLDQHM